MATGFVDRYKGKVAQPVGGMYIGGIQVNTTGGDMNTSLGWGVVPTSTASSTANSTTPSYVIPSSRAAGIDIFAPTSSGAIVVLPAPFPGANKVLQYSTVNGSTACKFKCSTTAGVTIQGANSTTIGGLSLTVSMTSTITCTIDLLGLSTTAWLFQSVWPSTTGHLTFAAAT